MNPFRKWLMGMAVLIYCISFCKAQEITSHRIELPGSSNRVIIQMARDDEGFIWFTTNEGLWRYDGGNIKLLDNKKLHLPGNASLYYLFCYSHFLIVSQDDGSIYIYDKNTQLTRLEKVNGWVTSVNRLAAGGFNFITTYGECWSFTKGDSLKKLFTLENFRDWEKGMQINRSIMDKEGNLYVCCWDRIGLVGKNNITWSKAFTVNSEENKNRLGVVIGAAITSRFIAVQYFSGQLAIYDRKTMNAVYFCKETVFATCLAVGDEILVVPHSDSEPVPVEVSPFFKIARGIFTESSKVFAVVRGDNNNFLLGSTTGLAELNVRPAEEHDYYNQEKMVHFFLNKSIRSFYRLDNKLYVGTYSGFFECSGDSIRQINSAVPYTMKQESAHRLLLGIEGGNGFALYDNRTNAFTIFPKLDPDHDIYTTALFKDGDGWISGDYSFLHRLEEKNGTWHMKLACRDSAQGIRQICRIRGTLYVAAQGGLYKLETGNKLHKIYPADGAQRIYCIQEVPDGLWLGTHGDGLVKINEQGQVLQKLGFNEGLSGNFVYSLALMKNLLVAGTGGGVNIFDLSGNAISVPVKQDAARYGMTMEECNHSAIFYDSLDGKVFIGGVKGLSVIDGRDYGLRNSTSSDKLILSYIKKGNHETNSAEADLFACYAENIRIYPKDANLVLKFSSPWNRALQDGLFRIRELDEKWQRIKLDQEINIYSLPPGKYHLEARLPSSIKEKEWFSRLLIVEPAFYQTVYFKLIIALALLGIIYLAWKSKIKKIKSEQKLRTTIASDLHDDIGSTLNSISVYTEIAKQQLQPGAEKTKLLLEKMGMASRAMIDNMSDIVWAINPKNDDFEEVLQRMQFFAGELLSGKNILLNFQAAEKVKKLKFTMQERKNIYLIFKEAVNNSYKYSGAKNVLVSIDKKATDFDMTIVDDGKGFDPEIKSNAGNGLVNMKKRAAEIGGKLVIENVSTGGIAISLHLKML